MRRSFEITALVLVILTTGPWVLAKPWRGITPLRSTRTDLTKAFGPSPDANEIRANYDIGGEHAYIVFSTRLDYYPECQSTLPTDTVMVIQVRPSKETPLSHYEKDLSRFRVVEASTPPGIGYKGYIDEKEGVAYVTAGDVVDEIYYFASAEDKHLCKRYVEDPETFIRRTVDFFPTVDEYGVTKFVEERARLDNFAYQLKRATKSKGFIIVYPGGKITKKQAQLRANKALKYVTSKWQFNKDRIEAIVDPKQESFSVHLEMYPKDVAPYVRDEEQNLPAAPKLEKPKNW